MTFLFSLIKDLKILLGKELKRLYFVAIARALFHEREVLILDEATSSLDMKTEEEIVNQMQKFKGEKTVITIAHRISSLKYCDCLYKLEKGRISGPYTYDDFLLTLEEKKLS